MCQRLGVRHFSRKGRGYLELDTGTFASKTKHGNHNRWLWEYAGDYDVVMFVDTDHVPLPIMAERLLGYFRDPDVAFVVGPAVLRQPGQPDHPLGGVGAVPVPQRHPAGGQPPPLRDAGRHQRGRPDQRHQERLRRLHHRGHGDQPEDPRHQERGRPAGAWRSVYTPDLVAVGEGPSSWTEFFGQQARWSAGTFDAIAPPGLAGGVQAPARAPCCTTS